VACGALALAGVLWVPSGQPGHRPAPQAAAADRLAMLRLAIAGHPEFRLDDGDVMATAPTYTVPTLERLRRELGGERPLVLLLGADAFLGLPRWQRWRELFALAHVAVATRPGHELSAAALPAPLAAEFAARQTAERAALGAVPAGAILTFAIAALEISATAIRAQLACGESPRYLLPDAVLDYICRHRLYAD
jgi:nicotinate-nucleotide adenylyltransferase